ncbi:MAG: hypothetical protein EKK53_11760 [Burkholderiales bacterium]|nr:MAG: hypothetical protein EKK53_11760 [Burkholderiales bacterium]
MDQVANEYRALMLSLTTGKMTADDFQQQYLAKFKNERRRFKEPLYEILQLAFGYADSFTSNSELLALKPDFYLDEARLKTEIAALMPLLTQQ